MHESCHTPLADWRNAKTLWERELSSWVFRVEPIEDESFSHVLGRFRRANVLSSGTLSELININRDDSKEPLCGRAEVENWERPSSRAHPSEHALDELCRVMQIEKETLSDRLIYPSKGEVGQWHLQTRLCSACYAQVPIHRMRWQRTDLAVCEEHGRKLLSACPGCGTGFRLPSLWAEGRCDRCWLSFSHMGKVVKRGVSITESSM